MPWRIQYTRLAEKQLSKLSPEIERRIRSFFSERLLERNAPETIAKRLSGNYEDKIRYRIGDYRAVCQLEHSVLIILVIEVAHRRDVYR